MSNKENFNNSLNETNKPKQLSMDEMLSVDASTSSEDHKEKSVEQKAETSQPTINTTNEERFNANKYPRYKATKRVRPDLKGRLK